MHTVLHYTNCYPDEVKIILLHSLANIFLKSEIKSACEELSYFVVNTICLVVYGYLLYSNGVAVNLMLCALVSGTILESTFSAKGRDTLKLLVLVEMLHARRIYDLSLLVCENYI